MVRRFISVAALVLAWLVPADAGANSLTMSDWTTGDFANNAANGGGPFKATTDTMGEFVTFCIEFNEHVGYGHEYVFTLSDGARSGGVSGQLPGTNYDPLSDATKWIYTQVRTGGYTSVPNYFGTGAGIGARVQEAIWYLEGERTAAEIGGTSSGSYLLAQYALTQDWNSLYLAGNRVYAMNILTLSGGAVQDQLAWEQQMGAQETPVPEPGTLALFGGAMVGLSSWRQRRMRSRLPAAATPIEDA